MLQSYLMYYLWSYKILVFIAFLVSVFLETFVEMGFVIISVQQEHLGFTYKSLLLLVPSNGVMFMRKT